MEASHTIELHLWSGPDVLQKRIDVDVEKMDPATPDIGLSFNGGPEPDLLCDNSKFMLNLSVDPLLYSGCPT